MFKTINHLIKIIELQNKIIIALMIFALGKKLEFFSNKEEEPVKKQYRKLIVDDLPIIINRKKLDYKQILTQHLISKGKNIKPVKQQKNSNAKVPSSITCPVCGAPHHYIYDNNGGHGQYKCKICSTNFNKKNYLHKSAIFKCPHCGKTLEKIKDRNDFYLHKCKNDLCSFYINNINSMTKDEKKLFKKDPQKFKLRYIYREFKFDFKSLKKDSISFPVIDLSKKHFSDYTLGLVLSYNVNFQISARRTAELMREIHGVSISRQTVLNYAKAVATNIKPMIDNFPYQLSDQICGDETYVKVLGKWNYIFFIFDAEKKIILSHYLSPNRDTTSACRAIDEALSKFKELPEDLKLVVDGNPIYLLAQHFFAQNDTYFKVKQVIGLSNDDPVSAEYRPLKQIIERLNRTFKKNYKFNYGYNSFNGAYSSIVLFTAYFNFLRPHSSIENRVPVIIPELQNLHNMPARWGKLIQMSQEYILSTQI